MKVVYVMVGPPCSGKSTFAKEIAKDRSFIRLNRDELRIMFRGRYSFGENYIESLVNDAIKFIGNKALEDGKIVVLDATHCKMKYINDVKSIFPEDTIYKYVVFDIPYWKQRWRNFWRYIKTGIWIPKEVSKVMHNSFQKVKEEIKNEQQG